MDDTPKKISMIFYLLDEGDVKEPTNKFEITPNKLYTIGRSKKEVDIVLDEKLLSRKHAELIYYHSGKIMIRDLDSRNGTYINKKRIEPFRDTYFSIKDVLSFGNITNEVIFYDGKSDTRPKNSEREKSERINQDEKKEKKSYQKEEKNDEYNSNNYYNKKDSFSNRNRKSKPYSDKSRSKSRERSRSREKYNEQPRKYSKEENSYKKSNKNYNDKEYKKRENDLDNDYENLKKYYENGRKNNGKSLEKYRDLERRTDSKKSYRREEYSRRDIRERERERDRDREREDLRRNSPYRRSQRNRDYDDEEYGRDKIVLNIDKSKEIEENFGKNPEDAGYIKCYVSGYMILNIKK